MPVRNIIYTMIFMVITLLICIQRDALNTPLIDHYAGLRHTASICAVMAAYNLVASLFRYIDYATEES